MIKKPTGYDEAATYTGEVPQLPKGKYVCVIKQVSTQESRNGNQQFVILFDIAEGEYKDFYKKMFDEDKAQNSQNAKWKGVFKQNMEGRGTPWFKGVITSIERSNNFTFRWDQEKNEDTLKGKKFGGLFGREQFLIESGEKRMATRLMYIRSIEGLKNAEIPEDKLLPEGPTAATPAPMDPAHPLGGGDGFMNIPDGIDEELPFM